MQLSVNDDTSAPLSVRFSLKMPCRSGLKCKLAKEYNTYHIKKLETIFKLAKVYSADHEKGFQAGV